VLRSDVSKLDVARKGAEERDSVANQDGISINDGPLNHAGTQKVLHRDTAIDIDMLKTASGKLENNFCWVSGHLFDSVSAGHFLANRRKIDRASTKNDYAPVPIWSFRKSENSFKSVAADHECIDGSNKVVVTVGIAVGGKEVVSAVAAGNEAVKTDTNKDRSDHAGRSLRVVKRCYLYIFLCSIIKRRWDVAE
jgi:hypothetical protein